MTYRPALLLFLLLNLFVQTCSAQTTINMVTNQWPPYVDDAAPEKGLAVELVSKALQRKGYQSRLHIDSWPRALEGVKIGVFDATCAIWKTAERERDLLFSDPYLNNKVSFIKKKSLLVEYAHFTDLTGFIISPILAGITLFAIKPIIVAENRFNTETLFMGAINTDHLTALK